MWRWIVADAGFLGSGSSLAAAAFYEVNALNNRTSYWPIHMATSSLMIFGSAGSDAVDNVWTLEATIYLFLVTYKV